MAKARLALSRALDTEVLTFPNGTATGERVAIARERRLPWERISVALSLSAVTSSVRTEWY
jgi:hypothetical protein